MSIKLSENDRCFLNLVKESLGIDCHQASFGEVLSTVDNVDTKMRNKQLKLCKGVFICEKMWTDTEPDHWHLNDSLPLLFNAGKDAKAPAARVEAINGLGTALRRCSDKERIEIRKVIKIILKSDSNKTVRNAAASCLREF